MYINYNYCTLSEHIIIISIYLLFPIQTKFCKIIHSFVCLGNIATNLLLCIAADVEFLPRGIIIMASNADGQSAEKIVAEPYKMCSTSIPIDTQLQT